MDIAISVQNLSRKYRLYESPQPRLKEALHPFRKKYHRDFWASKDVSFEVKKGESFGKSDIGLSPDYRSEFYEYDIIKKGDNYGT